MTHIWIHATMCVEEWNSTHVVSIGVGFKVKYGIAGICLIPKTC